MKLSSVTSFPQNDRTGIDVASHLIPNLSDECELRSAEERSVNFLDTFFVGTVIFMKFVSRSELICNSVTGEFNSEFEEERK